MEAVLRPVVSEELRERLPPILTGAETAAVQERVEAFYFAVAAMYEAWVSRRKSPHTQRAYRQDIMSFVRFLEMDWPKEANELLAISVSDVQGWRDQMAAQGVVPRPGSRMTAWSSS